jgi:hypothetical protein
VFILGDEFDRASLETELRGFQVVNMGEQNNWDGAGVFVLF